MVRSCTSTRRQNRLALHAIHVSTGQCGSICCSAWSRPQGVPQQSSNCRQTSRLAPNQLRHGGFQFFFPASLVWAISGEQFLRAIVWGVTMWWILIIAIVLILWARYRAEGYSNFGASSTLPTPASIVEAAMPARLPAYNLAPVAHMVYPEVVMRR